MSNQEKLPCPRCGQSYVEDTWVVRTRERVHWCSECDATWPHPVLPTRTNWIDLGAYLEERGIPEYGFPLAAYGGPKQRLAEMPALQGTDMGAVLRLAIDGFPRFCEVVPELQARHPHAGPPRLTRIARDVVRGLLDFGLVEIYQVVEPDGEPELLDEAAQYATIEQPGNWARPEHGQAALCLRRSFSAEDLE
jgi:hypothetical protein